MSEFWVVGSPSGSWQMKSHRGGTTTNSTNIEGDLYV